MDLKAEGFQGFVTVQELLAEGYNDIPREPGVYGVLRTDHGPPAFLERSRGGWFKKKNPTLPIEQLARRWIGGADAIYIGKGNELRQRIRKLCRFGSGQPVDHRGGYPLWQLSDCYELLVAWRVETQLDPFDAERDLLCAFREEFGSWPFANSQGPRGGC